MISIKNVTLPNKPLNNFELEEASKKLKIKCFRGVFLLDTLPRKLIKKNVELLTLIKVVALGRIGLLGIKMVKIKFTLIVMVFNHREKLLSIWEMILIIILIKYNQEERYFAVICVYTYLKN